MKPVLVLYSSLVRLCEARLTSSIKSMFGSFEFRMALLIFLDDVFLIGDIAIWVFVLP